MSKWRVLSKARELLKPVAVARKKIMSRSGPPAERDTRTVGTVFIDVLFGAVVAKALDLSSAPQVTALQQAHLVLAIIVTATAWLGYHNSKNRAKYVIRFFNLPLFQFTIEICFVYTYWLLVVTASQPARLEELREQRSISSAANVLVCVFILSCAWDRAALAMRRSSKYGDMKMDDDKPARRKVTQVFLLIFILISILVNTVKPSGYYAMSLMVALSLIVIAHRWVQNLVELP